LVVSRYHPSDSQRSRAAIKAKTFNTGKTRKQKTGRDRRNALKDAEAKERQNLTTRKCQRDGEERVK
jgi:hypothetical protein